MYWLSYIHTYKHTRIYAYIHAHTHTHTRLTITKRMSAHADDKSASDLSSHLASFDTKLHIHAPRNSKKRPKIRINASKGLRACLHSGQGAGVPFCWHALRTSDKHLAFTHVCYRSSHVCARTRIATQESNHECWHRYMHVCAQTDISAHFFVSSTCQKNRIEISLQLHHIRVKGMTDLGCKGVARASWKISRILCTLGLNFHPRKITAVCMKI